MVKLSGLIGMERKMPGSSDSRTLPKKVMNILSQLLATGKPTKSLSFSRTSSTPETTKKQIDKDLKKAIKQRKEEKEKNQKAAQNEGKKLWEEAVLNSRCDYFARKKIPELYGTKTRLTHQGRAILVPMRDVEGELHGVQTIYSDGSKYFQSGQRIMGCFHVVGDDLLDGNNVYICEGYSTATSIHQAIGRPVVVAFNSGNLASVAKEIKAKYTKSPIIICGDDDQFNKRPDGEPYNAGREEAEKACSAVLGAVVFPDFTSLDSKPTDFNDMHLQEGLEKVKEKIIGVKSARHYILHLGFAGDTYYYSSSANKHIISRTAANHSKPGLLSLMPLAYWASCFPANTDFDLTLATDTMMRECRKRGVFSTDKIRGTGGWKDGGRLVYNLGNALWYDDEHHDIHELTDEYFYELGVKIPAPTKDPLAVEECGVLNECLGLLNWTKPESAALLAGWLTIAPVCGALQWRPHIWLTGPSGSGKSYIMENIIERLVGDFGIYPRGQTTEAGLRQSAGCDARPVIFDEFETNDKKSGNRIAGVVELFRQASSETKGFVLKGSASGGAIRYNPQFCALVSSVRVNLSFEADENRFTIMDIKRNSDTEKFKKIKELAQQLRGDFALRLFARTVRLFGVLEQNIDLIREVLSEQHNPRFGQQYGALLGGYSILCQDEPINRSEAEMLAAMLPDDTIDAVESDEANCLSYLLERVLTVETASSRYEKSIVDIVEGAMTSMDLMAKGAEFRETLMLNGMKVQNQMLFVANRHPGLSKVFKESQWESGWAKSLARIKDAERSKLIKFRDVHKKVSRCVGIPLANIFGV